MVTTLSCKNKRLTRLPGFASSTKLPSHTVKISQEGFFCPEREAEKKLPDVLQALSDYWIRQMNNQNKQLPIIIATDGAKASQKQFNRIVKHFTDKGIDVYVPYSQKGEEYPLTLGILSYYVKYFRGQEEHEKMAAGGLLITVGQNNWKTVGLKIIQPNGTMAHSKVIQELNDLIQTPRYLKANNSKRGQSYTLKGGSYCKYLSTLFDPLSLKRAEHHIYHDALNGSSGYNFGKVLEHFIKNLVLVCIRDGYFDRKYGPETMPNGPLVDKKNKKELVNEMKKLETSAKIGFINDSDTGISQVIVDNLKFIPPSDIGSALLYHFVVNKRRWGRVIKTHDTSSLLDDLASKFGFHLEQVPCGYHQVNEALQNNNEPVLLACDSEGGLTGLQHVPVKDGLFTNIALLELLGVEKLELRKIIEKVKRLSLLEYTLSKISIVEHQSILDITMNNIKDLALKGGVIYGEKINLRRTRNHNKNLAERFDYKNEYKLFFNTGHWVVVQRLADRIKFTIETQHLNGRLSWFNKNKHKNHHRGFTRFFIEKVCPTITKPTKAED